ncbi:MAG: hypothetical protein WEC83_01670 [Patescibacteria group bacterium]
MPTTKSPRLKSPSNLPEAIFAAGALLAILGGFNFASAHFSPDTSAAPALVSSNTQRNLAIQEALKNGQTTYQFESNFIPGIGNITNPDAYKKQFEENSEEQSEQ